MTAAVAFSAPAQQTIIFSKPSDLSADKANSFLPAPNRRAGDYNAPRQLFNDYTPSLPMPAPVVVNNNNDASVRDALNRRKNWTLLTSEQILGIQTPEEILKVPDRTGEKNLSLEEQYLLRESRSEMTAATNARAGAALWRMSEDNSLFGNKDKTDQNGSFRSSPQKMELGTRTFGQLIKPTETTAQTDTKTRSIWSSVFTQPSQPELTDAQMAEQKASMEGFRALMEPSSPPDQTPVATHMSVAAKSAPNPFLQPAPAVNPAGRAITPLANSFSRPAGINPLPGISTAPAKPVATRPSWQAQPPPWLQSGPPAHNPNQNF